VAGISHLLHGNVDLRAMGWLLLGSVPGILLGSQLTVRLPDRALRVGLATVLLLSGIELLDVPGSSFLTPLVLAGGIALLAWTELRRLSGRVPAAERAS
jgi:hypothetical protein